MSCYTKPNHEKDATGIRSRLELLMGALQDPTFQCTTPQVVDGYLEDGLSFVVQTQLKQFTGIKRSHFLYNVHVSPIRALNLCLNSD